MCQQIPKIALGQAQNFAAAFAGAVRAGMGFNAVLGVYPTAVPGLYYRVPLGDRRSFPTNLNAIVPLGTLMVQGQRTRRTIGAILV